MPTTVSKSHKAVKKWANLMAAAGKPRSPQKPLAGPPPTSLAVVSPSTPPEDPIVTSPIQEEVPAKCYWKRNPNSVARKHAETVFIMRAAGHDDAAIAKRMKKPILMVRQYVYLARKNGWVDTEDEPIDVEAELAMNIDRKLIRNLAGSLDGQMTNWQTHEMTLAGLKGRGHFKNHETTKVEGAMTLGIIGVQIVMPPVSVDDQKIDIPDAMVGGVPAYVDGEVVERCLPATT